MDPTAEEQVKPEAERFRRLTLLLLLVSLATLLVACGGGNSGGGGNGPGPSPGSCDFRAGGDCTIITGGVTRHYWLHIPSTYKAGVSALVIALHPSRSDGPTFQQNSQLSATADQHGFAIAYPTALQDAQGHTAWNVYFSDATFSGTPPDDVGFIRALINTLQSNLSPDSKQIFVTGFSLGSAMTHRVGVEVSDLVAAIAPYEDTMYGYSPPTLGGTIPNSTKPVSVLMISGSHTSLPDICGYDDSKGNVLASMDDGVSYWTGTSLVMSGTSANACTTFDTNANFCTGKASPSNPNTQTSLDEKKATGCAGGAVVQVYKLWGGTHTWYPPSVVFGSKNCSASSSPPCNPNFDSSTGTELNDIIWNFFASHPKP
jgi:polyhydroxybutyrate depolymerase